MARTVGVVFGLSILFTSLRYCFDRPPFYIVREIREHSTNVKEHKAKVRHSTYSINSILRRGLQNEHVRLFQDSSILQISHRVHQKSRKMPSKKHKTRVRASTKQGSKSTLRHWLAVIANRNQGFSICHEGTHTTRSLWQAAECLTFSLIRYELRQQLQTYRELQKYRQLMRSTWRIETMVLPELSRTMAYTTRTTVNKLARNDLNVNPEVLE